MVQHSRNPDGVTLYEHGVVDLRPAIIYFGTSSAGMQLFPAIRCRDAPL